MVSPGNTSLVAALGSPLSGMARILGGAVRQVAAIYLTLVSHPYYISTI
jgi:hypothetical protein